MFLFDISTYNHYLFSPVKPSLWIVYMFHWKHLSTLNWNIDRNDIHYKTTECCETEFEVYEQKWKKENIKLKAKEHFQSEMFWPHWQWLAVNDSGGQSVGLLSGHVKSLEADV